MNTIQIVLPLSVGIYLFTLFIRHTFAKAIELQQEQLQELNETRNVLISQERIETLKTVAGGISHDFNNALTIILANMNLVNSDPQLPPHLEELLQEMSHGLDSAKKIANQMLNLVQTQEKEVTREEDLREMIRSTTNLSISGRKAIAEFDIDDDLHMVYANKIQINQVMLNLVINAVQSMGDTGKLKVKASNTTLPSENNYDLSEGEYIEIHVIDYGSGVPSDIDVFNLFTTTKENGSGIGLAISKNIINRHNGYINYRNVEEAGADFYFLLPAIPSVG
jgi:signal transduction histidine kinase